jgi:molybdenum cofactor biosynthesis enzyme
LEHRLKAEAELACVQAEKNKCELLQGVCQQIKASQLDLQAQLADLISRLDRAGHILFGIASGSNLI